MNTTENFEKTKKDIINYYQLVDIKKTGGFTDEPNKIGHVKGEYKTFVHPNQASDLLKSISMGFNNLIASGEMSHFRKWLRGYERKIKYS